MGFSNSYALFTLARLPRFPCALSVPDLDSDYRHRLLLCGRRLSRAGPLPTLLSAPLRPSLPPSQTLSTRFEAAAALALPRLSTA